MPTANCLHYATQCFEGMKLYRSGADGRLRLFRPARNAARMRMSCSRIALPDFEPDALEALIKKLCAVDGGRWLPKERGDGFLYIRPAMIGSDPALGVNKPKEALLYVILCVFPALDVPGVLATGAPQAAAPPPSQQANGEGNASLTANGVALPMRPRGRGMRLLASPESEIRAWPGGFGFAKLGANYGPTLEATGAARVSGYDQVLWLFGDAAEVTEAGAANFFVVWRGKESGRLELVTAPLDSRIILEGVTRASVLDLARERLTVKENVAGLEPVDVVERTLTIHEILDAYTEGRLIEAFAAGTAFFIAPVGEIHFRGTDIEVPLAEGNSGSYAKNIKDWLKDIMWGRVEHEWGVVVPDEGVPGVV
ncbi:aminotransferase [Lineolata rhizophorae]|uniref:Branched-chain-amino-acid aminotransferase n=1 Tax=Lineolata rhizophorae TaxID=578093 RepID=A0A6A6PBX1_9PEZI|nr:aminotransferase [Lineolata rhizophorae]